MYSILFSLLACRNALNILYHKKHAAKKNTNKAIMSKPVSILLSTILYGYVSMYMPKGRQRYGKIINYRKGKGGKI